MELGSNFLEVFKKLASASMKIELECEYARDDHLGYITTCPSNLGTGMKASAFVSLP